MIVVDDFLRESFADDAARRPEVYRHIQDVLARHDQVFDRDGVELYRPRP